MPSLGSVAVVVALLAVAFLFARVALHAALPAPAAIVLVGIAASDMLPHDLRIELTPATLGLFLPALIFEGAWSIDASALRRAAPAIAMLAIPGVLFTCGAIALAGYAAGGMALPAAFALGAILSATDPIAVLSLFRRLNVPVTLLTIVEGESIANDGAAAALVQVALLAGAATAVGATPLLSAAVVSPLAGIAIGIVCARVLGALHERSRSAGAGIAVTLLIAYGSYALATLVGVSGIFASAAAGIVLPKTPEERAEAAPIERFWDGTATLANGVVFLLVGLSIRFERIFAEPRLLLATIVAVIGSRLALAYVFVPVARGGSAARAWRHAIALSGIRGGLSLALALGLPYEFPDRAMLIDATFAVVFLTLVVQGWTLAPLVRRLPLGAASRP